MTETLITAGVGILAGMVLTIVAIVIANILLLRAYRSGATMVDRIHHDQVPFDEELVNEQMPSHTDGRYMDEQEE